MQAVTRSLKTFADYSGLPDRAPYQLIGGELVNCPAPTPFHQIVVCRLTVQLTLFIEKLDLGEVLNSPIDVYFSEYETYQPDIIFIARERKSIIGEKKIEGPPDLVVEVLSPSTGYYDLVHKKSVYEETCVKEYWLLDPNERQIQILENTDGKFTTLADVKRSGQVASKLLDGLIVEVETIFKPL